MEIRPVTGCAIGKGLFASFAGYETTDILPMQLVTECMEKFSKNCDLGKCPRFRIGIMSSHKISWRKEGVRM